MVETYPFEPPLTTTTTLSSADVDEYFRKAPKHLPKTLEEEKEASTNALWIKANWPFHFHAIASMNG